MRPLVFFSLPGLACSCVFISGDDQRSFVDSDGDGVAAPQDCNDARSDVAPGLTELCDGLDNDCDGEVDEELFPDDDGDGFGGEPGRGGASSTG